jgi:hypothetical protein
MSSIKIGDTVVLAKNPLLNPQAGICLLLGNTKILDNQGSLYRIGSSLNKPSIWVTADYIK